MYFENLHINKEKSPEENFKLIASAWETLTDNLTFLQAKVERLEKEIDTLKKGEK